MQVKAIRTIEYFENFIKFSFLTLQQLLQFNMGIYLCFLP